MEGEACIPDFPGSLGLVHEIQHTQIVHLLPAVLIQSMYQIEVDIVRFQTGQGFVQDSVHVFSGIAGPCGKLGGDIHLFPVAVPQCVAQCGFVLLIGIDICGIHIVYAVINGIPDGGGGNAFIHHFHAVHCGHGETHAAYAERRDFNSQLLNFPHFHNSFLL